MTNEENEKDFPIITVIGKDQKGIVAQISTFLWEKKINIEEIQQGVMKGNFFMAMSVNAEGTDMSTPKLSEELEQLGNKIGVKINIYDKQIFTAMHKI